MDLKSCLGCGADIPELIPVGKKYKFKCFKCGCETKTMSLFDAQKAWNEGIIYPDDAGKFWSLVFKEVT